MTKKRPFKVFLVDDDKDILDLLTYNLEQDGFVVKALSNSKNALEVAKSFKPDLIILDIMMPQPNGIEICRALRAMNNFKDTYIFFLTAKHESYYQQAAFETGGDDFIEKVVGLRALRNKINSVLKKKFVIRKSVDRLRIGKLQINRRTCSVEIQDNRINLNKPEFELLYFFAQNPGKTISVDNILNNIWGSKMYLSVQSIDVYIQNLSDKIGLNVIKGSGNKGYVLNCS